MFSYTYNFNGKIYPYNKTNQVIIAKKILENDKEPFILTETIDSIKYKHEITFMNVQQMEAEKCKSPCLYVNPTTDDIKIPEYKKSKFSIERLEPSDLSDKQATIYGLEIVKLLFQRIIMNIIDNMWIVDDTKNTLIEYFSNINIIKYVGRQFYLINGTHISKHGNIDIKEDDSITMLFGLFGFNTELITNNILKFNDNQRNTILTAFKRIEPKPGYSDLLLNMIDPSIEPSRPLLPLPLPPLHIQPRPLPPLPIVQPRPLPNMAALAQPWPNIWNEPTPQPNSYTSVMSHHTTRFQTLQGLLNSNPEVKITIPGASEEYKDDPPRQPESEAVKFLNGMVNKEYLNGKLLHNLGTGIARNTWPINEYKMMIIHLNQLIEDLVKKYPGRIKFDRVGDNTISATNIHVWGANRRNWNQPNGTPIEGSGQAAVMGIQRPGVFGIITMYSN